MGGDAGLVTPSEGSSYNSGMPSALVITAAGINCDQELARAFELAGAAPHFVHLTTLMADPSTIDRFDLIGIPGGFSYGDAVAAGRIAAQLMRRTLYPALVRAIERGVPIIAPCNGFQVAVQMGLLPGPPLGGAWPSEAPRPTVALAQNESARFVDRWCAVEIPVNTRCIWTQGLQPREDQSGSAWSQTTILPVAHGEGRFVAESDEVLQRLQSNGQIAVRYVEGDSPNGSADNIAGICDSSGLVFGLMPHPERYTSWSQHPWWTRLNAVAINGEPLGMRMFHNAVAYVTSARVSKRPSAKVKESGFAASRR